MCTSGSSRQRLPASVVIPSGLSTAFASRRRRLITSFFDDDLPLNSGFVAVVGNKGQGKSALLDCIALGGNSSRDGEFAFLSSTRFLKPANQKAAREYTTELIWTTQASRTANLTQRHDRAVPVSVEYLPQQFVERVCNLDPEDDDGDEFERELRVVLFTHIPESERAGENPSTHSWRRRLNRLKT